MPRRLASVVNRTVGMASVSEPTGKPDGAKMATPMPQIPGVKWRHPNPAEFYLMGDLGGPAVRAPVDAVPPRFRGAYGFAPAGGGGTQTASVER